MHMEKYKFAFISPSAEVGEAVRNCSDPETEVLIVELAPMEDAVATAKRLLNKGVEVTLGGGGTGSLQLKSEGIKKHNDDHI